MTTKLEIKDLPISKSDICITDIEPNSHIAVMTLADILVCAGIIPSGSEFSVTTLFVIGSVYAASLAEKRNVVPVGTMKVILKSLTEQKDDE